MKSRRSSGRAQVLAEGLDARRMAQIEPEDLEPVAPDVEVGLPGVARGRVAREPRGDDQVRACSQQLDPGLVADLHAAAGEQGDATLQVGRLAPLAVVELAAVPAQLVVERVDLEVALLADVAVLWVDDLTEVGIVRHVGLLEPRGREDIGRREHRLLAQHADAGLGQHRLVALELARLLPAADGLAPLPALGHVGVEDVARGVQQPRALLRRERREQAAIARELLEHVGGLVQAIDDRIALVLAHRHGRRVSIEGKAPSLKKSAPTSHRGGERNETTERPGHRRLRLPGSATRS